MGGVQINRLVSPLNIRLELNGSFPTRQDEGTKARAYHYLLKYRVQILPSGTGP